VFHLLTNDHMTIYNRVFDSTTRKDTYKRTQVTDVNWYSSLGTVIGSGVVTRSDQFKVRTPSIKNYVNPKDYKALVTKTGKWTVQRDDIVARGLLTTEITGMADLTKLGIECFKVNSYSDNRRGLTPHIRLGGE